MLILNIQITREKLLCFEVLKQNLFCTAIFCPRFIRNLFKNE
jgi:hypothetical protein